jgi:hypothetical protein
MGQSGFGGGPSFVSVADTAPTTPVDGQQWVRGTDLQLFFYSDSLSKWLGELRGWEFGHQNDAYAGFLQKNPRIGTDTTSAQEVGYYADAVLRVWEVHLGSGGAGTPAACTTYIFADQDTALRVSWEGAKRSVSVPNDTAASWVSTSSPETRVVFAATDVIAAAQKVGGGGTGAGFPHVWVYVREEVTP